MQHNTWKKSESGTEKRDEKRKRDLCKAAADLKQNRLFELVTVPHKSARVATFDYHEAASSSGLTASSSCHATHVTDPSLHTPSNSESVQP